MKTQEKRKNTGVIKSSLQNSPENVCFCFFFLLTVVYSVSHMKNIIFISCYQVFFLCFQKRKKKRKSKSKKIKHRRENQNMDHQNGCQDNLCIVSVNTFILLVKQKRKNRKIIFLFCKIRNSPHRLFFFFFCYKHRRENILDQTSITRIVAWIIFPSFLICLILSLQSVKKGTKNVWGEIKKYVCVF